MGHALLLDNSGNGHCMPLRLGLFLSSLELLLHVVAKQA